MGGWNRCLLRSVYGTHRRLVSSTGLQARKGASEWWERYGEGGREGGREGVWQRGDRSGMDETRLSPGEKDMQQRGEVNTSGNRGQSRRRSSGEESCR